MQLKKHYRKHSKQSRIDHIKAFIKFNTYDQDAKDALEQLELEPTPSYDEYDDEYTTD